MRMFLIILRFSIFIMTYRRFHLFSFLWQKWASIRRPRAEVVVYDMSSSASLWWGWWLLVFSFRGENGCHQRAQKPTRGHLGYNTERVSRCRLKIGLRRRHSQTTQREPRLLSSPHHMTADTRGFLIKLNCSNPWWEAKSQPESKHNLGQK